jgi:glycolate oxidase FAD binding subunit
MNAIATSLASILEPNSIHPWENLPQQQQKQIQQAIASATPPSCIVYPRTPEQLAAVITAAHRHNWRILPCGKTSKINRGGLLTSADIVISTENINQLIAHAVGDLTVTVAAGMQFNQLQAILAKSRQFIALDPSTPELATIGGIIATGDTNSLRQRYGSVRDQILGITFIRADGQIAKAGGRVVKNVAGYDLMKLFTGSYGTLGIISEVTLRVYPLPETSGTVVLTGTAEAISQAANILRSSALTPTQADLLSHQLVAELGLPSGLGLMVRFQSISESVQEQSKQLLTVGEKFGLTGTILAEEHEASLWQRLREVIDNPVTESAITCKIGVLPTAAVEVLHQTEMALVHLASGLGWLQLSDANQVLKMRDICEVNRGFLSVLTAPLSVKQSLDVWGYSGNALQMMRGIKAQFDARNILSPGRFVGGI